MTIYYFADMVSFEDDIEEFSTGPIFQNYKIETGTSYKVVGCRNEFDLIEKVKPNSLCMIDYGGLSGWGQSGLLDHLNRWFYKFINDHESVTFCFYLTMGKEWYADELFDFPNVRTINRGASLDEWTTLLKEFDE